VVSVTWAILWKTFVDFHNEVDPGIVDNSDLICPHQKFICCSEVTDMNRPFCLMSPREWSNLKSKHNVNYEISISLQRTYFNGDLYYPIESSSPEKCSECSYNKKQILEAEALLFVNKSLRILERSQYTLNHIFRDTHIEASHTMTVGELKLHIYQAWDILPYEQQLTYNDKELIDDSKILSEYGVTPLRPVFVTRVKVIYPDNEPIIIPTQKETGFAGTILTSVHQDNASNS